MTNQIAQLTLEPEGKKLALPIRHATLGQDVIEITNLGKEAGDFTFDPGFMSTASCESKITYIDGEQGILLYRGYPIQQLAEKSDFMEVAYLLLNGNLPTANQKAEFSNNISHHAMVHDQLHHALGGFERSSHPMSMMLAMVSGLSAYYYESLDILAPEHRWLSVLRLIAKMPTLTAMCFKYASGEPEIFPLTKMGYTENFLHMMFGTPTEEMVPNPVLARALDRIFILHADHEQNASTSTVRLAGSTGANPYACVAAGMAALWGPAHGGANEACLSMLEEIATVDRIPKYIERAKDPHDDFRLMGFGHRVYKNFDPRAKIMRETCHEVLNELGVHDSPLFKVAMALEKIALEDDYFISRKLYPNVDFYSGITLSALGVPKNMFTVFFALARTVGWMAQWLEMISDPNMKIGRPRQLYTGPILRNYVPIERR